VREKVETLNEEALLVTWSDFNTRLTSRHDQILVAKHFFLAVDEVGAGRLYFVVEMMAGMCLLLPV
jgi:hypothetical protein